MPSEVDIVNHALIRIGQNTISSLSDSDPKAVKANTIYSMVRDEIFASHMWNCLTRRVQLAQLADAPNHEFDYQYSLPSDFIRLVSVYDNVLTSIEHYNDGEGTTYRVLLSNNTPIDIAYIARITDPTRWDTLLRSAISFRMSAELAQVLHGSDTMAQQMWVYADRAMSQAQFTDSQQAWSKHQIEPRGWIGARTRRGNRSIDVDGQPL